AATWWRTADQRSRSAWRRSARSYWPERYGCAGTRSGPPSRTNGRRMPRTPSRRDRHSAARTQVLQLSPDALLCGRPQRRIDVGVDEFHHLASRGVVAELPQRLAHLVQPLFTVA